MPIYPREQKSIITVIYRLYVYVLFTLHKYVH